MADYIDNEGNQEQPMSAGEQQPAGTRQSPAVIEKFVIRLPKGLRNKIKHLSEQNRRSMNSEIIMVLEKHIQQNLLNQTSLIEDSLAALHGTDQEIGVGEQGADYELTTRELSRRLEDLPQEKKEALLELLG